MRLQPAWFLVLSCALLTAPLAAETQPAIPRIGVVAGGFPNEDPCLEALRHGLNNNVKTARALRLTVPQSLLLRADKLIQ